MRSTSVVSRAKSTNFRRSNWSENTETQTTVPTDPDDGDDQQNKSFEAILPELCYKYGCSVSVYVLKELMKDDVLKVKRKGSSAKDDANRSRTSSRRSTGRKVTAPTEVKSVTIEMDPNAAVITARYDKANRITELIMKKTNLHDPVIMQVISLLTPYYSFLNKILIQRCRINAYVIYNISKLLPLTTITDICLDESPLPEGNYAILLDVESNVVKHLSLARCLINDVVCEQIASKLHHDRPAGKQLLTLNLSSNRITDEGAKFLANALRTNRCLRYLNLSNNSISDEGFRQILGIIKEFPLTSDERVQLKKCYLQYLKSRLAYSIEQLHFAGLNSVSDSMGSLRSTRSPSNRVSLKNDAVSILSSSKVGIKKVKTQSWDNAFFGDNKSNSTKSEKPSNSRQLQIVDVNSEPLNSLYECMGPFNPVTVIEKDGWEYCKGNMVLSYINIAYNDLSAMGMKNLLSVLNYQNDYKQPGEIGLIKVNIEGNPLPVCCPDVTAINGILNKMLQVRRSSKSKSSII